jgi:hypothetical protein
VTKVVGLHPKKNGLQDQKNKRMINADTTLKTVFGGKSSVNMFDMTKLVGKRDRRDGFRTPRGVWKPAAMVAWPDTVALTDRRLLDPACRCPPDLWRAFHPHGSLQSW